MRGLRYKSTALIAMTAGGIALAEAQHPLMPPSGPYRVYEMQERTDLLTPEGTRKEVYGNFGPDGQGSYRIEIPLDALKPTATATPVVTWVTPISQPTATPAATSAALAPPSPTPTVTVTPTVVVCAPTPTSSAHRGTASQDFDRDIDPLVVKANHLYNQRRYVEASEYVDELLRRRPDYVRGWLMRGSLHKVLGHQALSESAYAHAKELEESP